MPIENPGNAPTGGQTGNTPPGMFTKERVNELMQRRIERSHQAFFNRYGVKDLNGLDELFGKAKSVDALQQQIQDLTKSGADLQSRYDELQGQNKDLAKKYAFTSRNVRPELYNDIETYFKGKGLDITQDTLSEELKTHPDWMNKASNVVPLGTETSTTPSTSERDLASSLLGVQL